jgi:3-oxoacyl-[acyl-carrier protein] reductase
MNKELNGTKVLITGAASGIGRATAVLFSSQGAIVCLVDRRTEELSKVVDICKVQNDKAFGISTDITSELQVNRMLQECLDRMGSIDVLINSAGYGKYGPFIETSLEEWDKLWNVNVRGTVIMMKAVVPSMISKKRGHIVNISSQHGLRTSANATAYCASKFAVTGLTDSLSTELHKYGIKVSLVCPGGVLTPFLDTPPEQKPQTFMDPEEIAFVLLSVVTTPGKALIKQVFVVPRDRPHTPLEIL